MSVLIEGALVTGLAVRSHPPHDLKQRQYFLTATHSHRPGSAGYSVQPDPDKMWSSQFEISKDDFERIRDVHLEGGVIGIALLLQTAGVLPEIQTATLDGAEFYRKAVAP